MIFFLIHFVLHQIFHLGGIVHAQNDCKIDLANIDDGSGSIPSDNFEKARAFSIQMVKQLTISPTEVWMSEWQIGPWPEEVPRDAIAYYSGRLEIGLTSNKSAILNALSKMKKEGGNPDTDIATAIYNSHKQLYYNGRPDAPNIIIIKTDGFATDPSFSTMIANEAKAAGITIIAIAIPTGSRDSAPINEQFLLEIASSPEYIFRLSDYSELMNILGDLVQKVCTAPPAEEKPPIHRAPLDQPPTPTPPKDTHPPKDTPPPKKDTPPPPPLLPPQRCRICSSVPGTEADYDNVSTNRGKCCDCFENQGGAWTALGCILPDSSKPRGFVPVLLTFGIGIAGGISFLLILWGGFLILTSRGNPEQSTSGREIIQGAVFGLLLIIFGLFILRFFGVQLLGIPGFG